MVDREQCVLFQPMFVGPSRCPVLHYRAGREGMREMPNLFAALREVDMPMEPIFCGGTQRAHQEREQWASGCNFIALRPGLALGYDRNENTYREMEREGYRTVSSIDYLTGDEEIGEEERVAIIFEGGELVRGGGGARCMTMPILRDDPW